ncbi:hypothetical protein DPMN_113420 [Dreissena polymorpha]|uniref:Uncharacterized protein n=1 Tax=Dreissena polymorpha TaxID=45954 RepID=A0A9D4KI96_DREPO|nr:hypothetical protein DPMN_113420 [Dreissena polymorpha]
MIKGDHSNSARPQNSSEAAGRGHFAHYLGTAVVPYDNGSQYTDVRYLTCIVTEHYQSRHAHTESGVTGSEQAVLTEFPHYPTSLSKH